MSYFIPVSSQLFENDKQQLDCNLRITTPRGQGSTGRSRLCRLHRNTQTASDSNDDINSPLRQPGGELHSPFQMVGPLFSPTGISSGLISILRLYSLIFVLKGNFIGGTLRELGTGRRFEDRALCFMSG